MKGDVAVIKVLNKLLGNELVAINQYFLHAKMLEDFGLSKLAEKVKAESIDEMKHADELIARILFLEGVPNLQDLGKLNIGEDVPEMLESDLNLEYKAIADLKEAYTIADNAKDFTSSELIESILNAEEGHIDWIETQLGLIKTLGLENYLQTQV